MQLHCPSCQRKIPAKEIELDTSRARCSQCQTEIDLVEYLAQDQSSSQEEYAELPSRYQIDESDDELTIIKKSYSSASWGNLVFCIIFNAFMLNPIFQSMNPFKTPQYLFFHPATYGEILGLAWVYFSIVAFVNKTVIQLNRDRLTVRYVPLPVFPTKTFPLSEIEQFYAKRHFHNQKEESPKIFYNLNIQLKNGKKERLLITQEPEYPRYLERRIEQFLGMEDRPVEDEMER